jgi:acyl carrier protein
MTTSEFLRLLADAIELDDGELEESTDLQSLEEFDSLAFIAIVALVDQHFQVRIGEAELKAITTPRSIMEMIGVERFD